MSTKTIEETSLFVAFSECTEQALFKDGQEVSSLFLSAFGMEYRELFLKRLGRKLTLAEIRRNDTQELVAIFPLTMNPIVRKTWASEMTGCESEWEDEILKKTSVITDFIVVSAKWRGTGTRCLKTIGRALAELGYVHLFTEVQWLRQLLYWTRAGWGAISEKPQRFIQTWREVNRAFSENVEPQTKLSPNEHFFWHEDPGYAIAKWNVALAERVLLVSTLSRSAGVTSPPETHHRFLKGRHLGAASL